MVLLSLLQESLSAGISVKSSVEHGAQVVKCFDNFYLLVMDNIYQTWWRIPMEISNNLFGPPCRAHFKPK